MQFQEPEMKKTKSDKGKKSKKASDSAPEESDLSGSNEEEKSKSSESSISSEKDEKIEVSADRVIQKNANLITRSGLLIKDVPHSDRVMGNSQPNSQVKIVLFLKIG